MEGLLSAPEVILIVEYHFHINCWWLPEGLLHYWAQWNRKHMCLAYMHTGWKKISPYQVSAAQKELMPRGPRGFSMGGIVITCHIGPFLWRTKNIILYCFRTHGGGGVKRKLHRGTNRYWVGQSWVYYRIQVNPGFIFWRYRKALRVEMPSIIGIYVACWWLW